MNYAASPLSVAVVVLNWNSATDTLACVESLRRSTWPCDVIVVDNGSTDDSESELRKVEADHLLCLGENLGYAGGNNAGLRIALAQGYEVIAVLNNDTVVMPNAIEALVGALADDEARALSPDVRYVDAPDQSWFAGGVIEHGWPRHIQQHEMPTRRATVRTSAWLAGCCIVAQSETWRLVGGFDERYFLIWEDAEWSIRARRQGVRLLVVDEAIIQHHVGHSFQHAPTALASFYFTRNGLRYQWQYARRHVPRFIRDWLVRPAPSLLRHRRGNVLLFAWLGALAWLIGQVGPVPPALSRLAERR